MTEHSHKFRVEWYEDGIERGVCDCGKREYGNPPKGKE